jgi:hypothetical protein
MTSGESNEPSALPGQDPGTALIATAADAESGCGATLEEWWAAAGWAIHNTSSA